MGIVGKLLSNWRAGEEGLAWNLPNLAGAESLRITSPDFAHESELELRHAGKRVGGEDLSPELSWDEVPAGTERLLLVIEDPDAPGSTPFVHCVALVDPTLTGVPRGGLAADRPAEGVAVLRSGWGRGYMGPSPIKGHGPHRYVFELFALTEPLALGGGKSLEAAKPREVLAAARASARGRIDGFYERP